MYSYWAMLKGVQKEVALRNNEITEAQYNANIEKAKSDIYAKNQFCKNDDKDRVYWVMNKQTLYFLLMIPTDKPFKTKYLSSQLGCARLSFASSEAMNELLLLLIILFYAQHHRTILANIGRLGTCVSVLILVAIGCASGLARLSGTGTAQRRTVVIEVSMQNAAQAIASSPFVFANEARAIPAILYSLMMNIILLG